MRDYLARTVLGVRGVRKERAKPFPTAPTHREIRGVNSDGGRFRQKLVVEPPVTVDLSFCLLPFLTSLSSLFFSATELHHMKSWLVSSHFAPAHLSFRGVFPLLLFFIKSARKLLVEPPVSVDLSLIVAAVTLAPAG